MNLKKQILELLGKNPGLTDREITNHLQGSSARQQPINKACHEMQDAGLIRRTERQPGKLIGNYLASSSDQSGDRTTQPTPSTNICSKPKAELSEDQIKEVLEKWLQDDGWEVQVAWGRERGIDIDARKGSERWIIEVKGPGSRSQMRVNYFIAMLGETLQRMDDKNSRYSIALPKMPQYEGLWRRLPELAKKRTTISILFVDEKQKVTHLLV